MGSWSKLNTLGQNSQEDHEYLILNISDIRHNVTDDGMLTAGYSDKCSIEYLIT